ncbi:MAG: heparinase II/III family protein [Firmicutes bacterium]|nr:heparinase II/III family protein [Bacillota bacterium]
MANSRVNGLKVESTYYVQEKIKAARENIEKYEWAKAIGDDAVALADKCLKWGYERLWELVTCQRVPRSSVHHLNKGCPICKEEATRKFGSNIFDVNCIDDPWKVRCLNCGSRFPSNDFGAYYKSGLDNKGKFVPELADRSLLKNTIYPDKPEDWCVDDGYGYWENEGSVYHFIAYYNQWGIWMPQFNTQSSHPSMINMLSMLRDAFIYTGEEKYASLGIVLLDRIADVYPELDITHYPLEKGYLNGWGSALKGKAMGCIWEISLLRECLLAYDAFVSVMKLGKCCEAMDFIIKKTCDFNCLKPRRTMDDVKRHIEANIIDLVYPAVCNSYVYGNSGMHQSVLALAAVVVDDPTRTKEMLDWIFRPGEIELEPSYHMSGGNISNILLNLVDRDGQGKEASLGYNSLWLNSLVEIAEILDGYNGLAHNNLYSHPKFKKMFSLYPHVVCAGRYHPTFADNGKTGNPDLYKGNLPFLLNGYYKYRIPELAQLIYLVNDNSVEGLHLSIFKQYAGQIADDIRQVIEQYGELPVKSINKTGYGLAILKSGRADYHNVYNDSQRDVWLYYGRNIWHGHRDTLNLGIHAFGLDLAPDLGYPEFARVDWPNRSEWNNNTISHNTVVVNCEKQDMQYVGTPLHYENFDGCKLIEVSAKGAYRCVDEYKRTVFLIDMDDKNSYIVDFFKVKGGNDHHYSFHGPEGVVKVHGIELIKQNTGTYAGPDVDFGVRADHLEDNIEHYKGSGFHYLYNVERCEKPACGFSVDWAAVDTWGVWGAEKPDVHLKLTMLTELDDVALADGKPPQNKPGNPHSLRYMIAHRKGEELETLFAAVIEPYKNKSSIVNVCLAKVCEIGCASAKASSCTAVKVSLANGRTDYIINVEDCGKTYTKTYIIDDRITFNGKAALLSIDTDNNRMMGAMLCDGTILAVDGKPIVEMLMPRICGEVVDFTREVANENYIKVRLDCTVEPSILAGRYVYIDNGSDNKACFTFEKEFPFSPDHHTYVTNRNAAYEIIKAEKISDNDFMLYIGDVSLINGYVDYFDETSGYAYNIAPGMRFYISLSVKNNF